MTPAALWTRRAFVRSAAGAAAGLGLVPLALGRRHRAASRAEDVWRIGHVAPADGPWGAAGRASALGAEFGAEEAGRLAELLGHSLELVRAQARGPEETERAARGLLEAHGVFALVGGADEAGALALAELADRHGLLFFNTGAVHDALRGPRCRPTSFHVVPSLAMAADALAWELAERRERTRWAYVVGPRPAEVAAYERWSAAVAARGGREVARIQWAAGPEAASALERALRAGADAVALCVEEPAAQEAFLRAVRTAAAPRPVACAFLPGRPLAVWPEDARGGWWPAAWHPALFRYGAEQLNARFRQRTGRPMDTRAWAAWMAVRAATETALRARTTEAKALVRALLDERTEFDGHRGIALSFREADRQLRQPVYVLAPDDETPDRFRVAATMPPGEPGPGVPSRTFLDRLGAPPPGARCGRSRTDPRPTETT